MTLRLAKPPRTWKPQALGDALAHLRPRRDLPTLAVLPFLDQRGDGPEAHLAEGIAEELLEALSHVEGLRVVSRTTSFPYGASPLSRAEVGHKLKAHAVLGGRLTGGTGLPALHAELVEVDTGRVVWTETCDFARKDLFAILGDLAAGVAAALKVTAARRPRYEANLDAYDFYLRGRRYYYQFNRRSMEFAAQMFRRALDLDPGYARAWAGLANCAAYTYIYIDRTEPQRQLAESCSRKALELDPGLAEAQASRGVALSAAGLAEEAEEAFETALRLDPNLYEAAYFYARHCFAAGKAERAVEYFEWAAALRPEDFQAILLVAQVYGSLGVADEAERARRLGLRLVEERLERVPEDVRARYLGANALVALGEREQGLAWARQARAMDPDDPMLLYNLGCIHALAGDPGEALDCLEAAAAGGLTQKAWFQHDGDLDSLREAPRFQALLDRLGG